ncbi:MAG: YraN family protein [Pseudomonadota bacterium]
MNTRPPPGQKGREEEERAWRYLLAQGCKARERNYRCRHGEIDLIMDDGEALVFIEVRYRAHPRFAGGAESVDRRKQAKLVATAQHYLQGHRELARRPARFDVVALAPGDELNGIEWIKNAFHD